MKFRIISDCAPKNLPINTRPENLNKYFACARCDGICLQSQHLEDRQDSEFWGSRVYILIPCFKKKKYFYFAWNLKLQLVPYPTLLRISNLLSCLIFRASCSISSADILYHLFIPFVNIVCFYPECKLHDSSSFCQVPIPPIAVLMYLIKTQ
jgi:hypothetical protein